MRRSHSHASLLSKDTAGEARQPTHRSLAAAAVGSSGNMLGRFHESKDNLISHPSSSTTTTTVDGSKDNRSRSNSGSGGASSTADGSKDDDSTNASLTPNAAIAGVCNETSSVLESTATASGRSQSPTVLEQAKSIQKRQRSFTQEHFIFRENVRKGSYEDDDLALVSAFYGIDVLNTHQDPASGCSTSVSVESSVGDSAARTTPRTTTAAARETPGLPLEGFEDDENALSSAFVSCNPKSRSFAPTLQWEVAKPSPRHQMRRWLENKGLGDVSQSALEAICASSGYEKTPEGLASVPLAFALTGLLTHCSMRQLVLLAEALQALKSDQEKEEEEEEEEAGKKPQCKTLDGKPARAGSTSSTARPLEMEENGGVTHQVELELARRRNELRRWHREESQRVEAVSFLSAFNLNSGTSSADVQHKLTRVSSSSSHLSSDASRGGPTSRQEGHSGAVGVSSHAWLRIGEGAKASFWDAATAMVGAAREVAAAHTCNTTPAFGAAPSALPSEEATKPDSGGGGRGGKTRAMSSDAAAGLQPQWMVGGSRGAGESQRRRAGSTPGPSTTTTTDATADLFDEEIAERTPGHEWLHQVNALMD